MTVDDLIRQLDLIPYAKTLGVTVNMEGSEPLFVLPFKQENIGNPILPALHGGVIGGFMELTAIAQLRIITPDFKLAKPIGINVDYLRRGKPEDVFAVAEITKQGERVSNVRVTAWQEDRGNPIATLHGHFMMAAKDD